VLGWDADHAPSGGATGAGGAFGQYDYFLAVLERSNESSTYRREADHAPSGGPQEQKDL